MTQLPPRPTEPTTGGDSGERAEDRRDIFDLAQACKDLFSQYTSSSSWSNLHEKADLQQQRFYVWASYLGVFAPFNASLDKRLQYSDEIRSLVVQMLSVLRRNLEFLAATDPNASAYDKVASISGLEGTPSEALEATEASINRLNRLGATIRKYSVSSLDERVNAFIQRHGDENYTQLARHIIRFKYKTATPSLQEHLALSMSTRRQRLRYLHRHQSKLASHTNTTPRGRIPERRAHPLPPLAPIGEDTEGGEQNLQGPMKMGMASRARNLGRSPMRGVRSETNASKFVPTPSVIARLRRGGGASVVSSSKMSSTFMAEAPEDYPDPPKRLPNHPEPTCLYCCQPLEERETQGVTWARHVNKDLCPFVCLSDKCAQGPHNFQDFSTWAKHMRDAHTTKWPQQIHKPLIWACDVDHDVEEFFEEGQFQEHLASQHPDCTDAEKRAIAETCQIPRKRPRNTCPICGYDLSSNEHPVKGKQELDKFAQLDLLAKHVAGHLRQLAFDSSKNLEDQMEATTESSLATSEANLVDKDSEVHRPSGADPLDGLPLEFLSMEGSLDYSSQQNLNSYDDQWSPEEIEILLKFPEDLSTSAVQEWSELRGELSESTDADLDTGAPDPILTHFLSRMENIHAKRSGSPPKAYRVMPLPRNKDITDRVQIFAQLETLLPPTSQYQSAALYGLGGSGKTQVALEYAYRRCRDTACSVFWVHAANETTFTHGYKEIARALGISNNLGGEELLTAVRERIESEQRWLLVLDNADDLSLFGVASRTSHDASGDQGEELAEDTAGDKAGNTARLYDYVPRGATGTVLWTSRDGRIVGTLVGARRGIAVGHMSDDEAMELLGTLRNGKVGDEEDADARKLLEDLQWLPLAISQAGALAEDKYRWRALKKTEFDRYRRNVPNSVLETWSISIERIRLDDEMAYKILHIIAYVSNQNIPFGIMAAAGLFGDGRQEAASWEDEDRVVEAVARLREFAFLGLRSGEGAMRRYEMHKLVQEATRYGLSARSSKDRVYFSTAALQTVAMLFPEPERERWAECEEYVAHAVQVGEWAEICEKETEVSDLLTRVSGYLYDRGRWREREPVDKRAYELRKRVLGEENPDTMSSMASLAMTYHAQGRYGEAEKIKIKVLELRRQVLGEEHPDTIWSMAELATTYHAQGRYDEAKEIDTKVLELRRQVLGEEHPDTIDSMASLAITYHAQGRYDEAKEIDTKVLELRRQVLGEEHLDTIKSMAELATAYHAQGRYGEAEELKIKVLELRRQVLGEEHPDTIKSMAELATAYHAQGRYGEAEELKIKVLELRRQVLGEKHPSSLQAMHDLAITWKSRGRRDDAIGLMGGCLQLRRGVLGPEHPFTKDSDQTLKRWETG